MDWKTLIADLAEAGLTQARIAKDCNCSQATVSDLANGATKEPRYLLGVTLKALHRRSVRRLKSTPQANPQESAHG